MKYEFDIQLDAVQRPDFDHGPIPIETQATDSLPSLTKALVLAYQIQQSINHHRFEDYADAARHLKVTRARISQLMKLTKLAPAIQEVILCEPDRVSHLFETSLRPIAMIDGHESQWLHFNKLILK